MLGLQAEGTTTPVRLASFTLDAAVEVVASVELNARLVRENFEHAAAGGFLDSCSQGGSRAISGQDPVMVVALAELQLLVILFDASANCGSFSKIEWRSAHRAQFSGWNQPGIDGGVAVGIQSNQMAKNIAVTSSFQIEIRMV